MCCFCWTHRERLHPRLLLRHRDQFYWWLPSWNPVPSNIWAANSFAPEAEPELHTPVAQLLQGKLPVSPGCWEWGFCWGKLQENTCFSDAIVISSGCLTPSGQKGQRMGCGRGVVDAHRGGTCWELPQVMQFGLVAPSKGRNGVSTDKSPCTIW